MVSHMLTFYTIFIYGELLLMIDDCLMVFSYLIMFIAMLNYQRVIAYQNDHWVWVKVLGP